MSDKSSQSLSPKLNSVIKTAGFTNLTMVREAADVLTDPQEMAELMGLSEVDFDAMLNQSHISGIIGLGTRYVGLLEAVGIKSLSELSRCEPFELHARITLAAKTYHVGRIPNRATIEDWIEQAQDLSPTS